MAQNSVTIVMPFYNEVMFLELGVNSVLSQRVSHVEILIVNDNPDRFDDAFFDEFSFPENVRVVHHEVNSGLSAARNTGIENATGDWIGFLDSDDYYLPLGLRAQYDEALASGADMIHGAAVRNRYNSPFGHLTIADKRNNMDRIVATEADVPFAGFGIFSSWSSLYKREFLLREEVRFDPEQRKFEDRLFVINAISKARKLVKMGEPVRVWRMRKSSITTSPNTISDSLLKLKAFEKCIDTWLANPAHREYALREFVRTWLHMFTLSVSSPFAHAYSSEAETSEDVRQELVRVFSKYPFAEAELIQSLKQDACYAKRTGPSKISSADFIRSLKSAMDDDRGTLNRIHRVFNDMDHAVPSAPAPSDIKPDIEYFIHVGFHKTGSTFLQTILSDNRELLQQHGLLFPETGFGFPTGKQPVRPGGLPGHQALLWAVNNDKSMFERLQSEISQSGCSKVLISIENASAPLAEISQRTRNFVDFLDAARIPRGSARAIAMLRRPDVWTDSFYREIAGNGGEAAWQSADEFVMNNKQMFALGPIFDCFESVTQKQVRLGDFDAMNDRSLLRQLLDICDLQDVDEGEFDVNPRGRYPSPCNAQVETCRCISLLQRGEDERRATLQSWFGMVDPTDQKDNLLSPDTRQTILQTFNDESAEFAKARGYDPDVESWMKELENAKPPRPTIIPEGYQRALMQAATWSAALPIDRTPSLAPWTAKRIAKGILRRVVPSVVQ